MRRGWRLATYLFVEISVIIKVEKGHEQRCLTFLRNVERGKVFANDQPVRWICREWGNIYEVATAPTMCPFCKHPQSYMEIQVENN